MYKCTLCNQTFYSQVDCAQHQAREHPDQSEPACTQLEYRCGYCGMAFSHRTDVSNHALRDHGIQRVEVREVDLA